MKATLILLGFLATASAGSPLWAAHPATLGVALAVSATGQNDNTEARRQADELLKNARRAMSEGNADLAQAYIERAERLGLTYDPLFSRFIDTPQKARRDLEEMRRTGRAPGGGLLAPRADGGAPSQDPFAQQRRDQMIDSLASAPKAQAQRHLENGRQALRQGEVNAAIAWLQKAREVNAVFGSGEYSPKDLEAELRQAGVDPSRLAKASAPPPATPQSLPGTLERLPPLADNSAQELANSPFARQGPANPFQVQTTSGVAPLSAAEAKESYLAPQTPARAWAEGRGPVRLPAVEDEDETAESGQGRAAALRLLAQAQAAMDRGDLTAARHLATQAQQLNVPDEAFVATDPRPWQLLLEIRKREGRAGSSVVPASAQAAIYNQNSEGASQVQPGVYRPELDTTRNVRAQATSPGPTPAPAAPQDAGPTGSLPMAAPPYASVNPDSPGFQHYQAGMRALEEQDRETALRQFREAWKYETELDPTTRQRLQDMLGWLRPGAPPQAIPPASVQASPLEQADAEQRILRQKLFREITTEQQIAEQLKPHNPKGALERLQRLRERVQAADLPEGSKRSLLTVVDRKVTEIEAYIRANAADIELAEQNQQTLDAVDRQRRYKQEVDTQLATLVDEFNTLIDQERYPEAEVLAKRAYALSPDSEIVQSLMWKARFVRRFAANQSLQSDKEQGVWTALNNVERSSVPFDDNRPYMFGPKRDWDDLTRRRSESMRDQSRRYNEAELAILSSLKNPVDAHFLNRPLAEVLHALAAAAGVPLYLDPQGLAAEGVTSDKPVTLDVSQPISLKSALQLILEPLHMGYVVQNEVLKVTSVANRDSQVYSKVYYVADLVIPIPNFIPTHNLGLPGAMRAAYQQLGYGMGGAPVTRGPLTVSADQRGPNSVSPLALRSALANYGGLDTDALGGATPRTHEQGSTGLGGAALADFQSLIDLITATIAPDTWDTVGGPGSVQPFPTNLSIVVSNTQEVHEQIADLLEQLRRLQDLQVTIEVRFITLSDDFFERIGVDFDFEIDDNVNPLLLAAGDRDIGPSMTVGLDPTGQPTADLDIPFSQGSFGAAVPAFGGFDPATAANFGVAILSDIEVFFLLQAAQGDSRTNVLQAPKVTMFNGQLANVADGTSIPFVVGVVPVVGDFAAAYQPVVVVVTEGTSLSVQAVVSNDRRFVRLTLVPFFSKVGPVQEFTFSGKTTTNSGTSVIPDPENPGNVIRDGASVTREGVTVQLPQQSFTTVSTTVSVPDGGTVLLGGIKRLREGRIERGVPLLSKIPYVNRLFKNVGIGRETQSLMMMVTPRIIIQEEEEEKLGIEILP